MIVGFFINLFYNFLGFLISLLPVTHLDSSIGTTIASFFASVYSFNSIFPVAETFTIIEWTFAFWAVVFLWDFIKWLMHLIRGN